MLLHSSTGISTFRLRRTSQATGVIVTRFRIIAAEHVTHERLALLVSAGTLAASTGEAAAALLAVGIVFIFGASTGFTRALLFGITLAIALPTYRARGRELAICAAFFVGIVTGGVLGKFARARIAALVVTAGVLSSAIALLSFFYYTIATLTSSDGDHVAVT